MGRKESFPPSFRNIKRHKKKEKKNMKKSLHADKAKKARQKKTNETTDKEKSSSSTTSDVWHNKFVLINLLAARIKIFVIFRVYVYAWKIPFASFFWEGFFYIKKTCTNVGLSVVLFSQTNLKKRFFLTSKEVFFLSTLKRK